MSVAGVILALLLSVPSPQQGGAPNGSDPAPGTTAGTQASASITGELPVSVDRIQRALSRPPTIRILAPETRDGRQVYRVDIEGEKIDIQTLLGRESLMGNASYGGMTHQEFLNLVTPNDVKGYAPFSNKQGMIVAATSIALQWAVLKAMDKFKEARDERAKEQARKEVEEALESLRRARAAAGLPEK